MTERITRSQMKTIIKECLIEILQEGMGSNMPSQDSISRRAVAPTHKNHLNKTKMGSVDMGRNDLLKNVIKNESRGNPVMEDIFRDTAVRTLPQMMNEGSGKTQVGVEHFRGDPEEIFGDEMASKWALLAFSEPKNKSIT